MLTAISNAIEKKSQWFAHKFEGHQNTIMQKGQPTCTYRQASEEVSQSVRQ
jgi:hypothetical protein